MRDGATHGSPRMAKSGALWNHALLTHRWSAVKARIARRMAGLACCLRFQRSRTRAGRCRGVRLALNCGLRRARSSGACIEQCLRTASGDHRVGVMLVGVAPLIVAPSSCTPPRCWMTCAASCAAVSRSGTSSNATAFPSANARAPSTRADWRRRAPDERSRPRRHDGRSSAGSLVVPVRARAAADRVVADSRRRPTSPARGWSAYQRCQRPHRSLGLRRAVQSPPPAGLHSRPRSSRLRGTPEGP